MQTEFVSKLLAGTDLGHRQSEGAPMSDESILNTPAWLPRTWSACADEAEAAPGWVTRASERSVVTVAGQKSTLLSRA